MKYSLRWRAGVCSHRHVFVCRARLRVAVSIQVGTLPSIVWNILAPYRGAVWIAGHHEWVNGVWVWVGVIRLSSAHGRLLGAGHYHQVITRPLAGKNVAMVIDALH